MDGGLPSKLLESLSDAAGIVRRHDFFHIYSHYDADGLAAAGIVAKALAREGKELEVTIFPTLVDEFMKRIEAADTDCVIVTDLGASYIGRFDAMKSDVIVLDHHTLGDWAERVCYANPHLYGIDGMSSGCGATMAFLFAIALNEANWDLSPVAMAGIAGDRQHLDGVSGLNAYLLEGAEKRGLIEERSGSLAPAGNLATGLFVGTDPYIRGVSGSAEGTAALLADAGIKGEETLDGLTVEEASRLSSLIAVKLITQGVSREKLEEAARARYRLPTWNTDAEALAEIINACGRCNAAGVGVAAAMGDKQCLVTAGEYDASSRKAVVDAISAIDADGLRQMEHIQWFDSSDSGFTGVICGAVMNYLGDPAKPTVGINGAEDTAKISSRGTLSQLGRGVDLADALKRACAAAGGEGGGHRIAAGGSVPKANRDVFLGFLDKIVGEQIAARSPLRPPLAHGSPLSNSFGTVQIRGARKLSPTKPNSARHGSPYGFDRTNRYRWGGRTRLRMRRPSQGLGIGPAKSRAPRPS